MCKGLLKLQNWFPSLASYFILHVMEQLAAGDFLFFTDCNVLKHWNLHAFPNLAFETTRWLLEAYGQEDVAMPRENPANTHGVICSAKALDAAESSCENRKDLVRHSQRSHTRVVLVR